MNEESKELTEQMNAGEAGYKKVFYVVVAVAVLYLIVIFA